MNGSEIDIQILNGAELAAIPGRTEWDTFVLDHPDGSSYHLSGWGQAVSQAYGHRLYYLLARKQDKPVGILPLIHLRFSFFLNELIALPFCDVGSCLSLEQLVTDKLINRAIELAGKLGAKHLQLRGKDERLQSISGLNSIRTNKVRMLLALPQTSAELLASLKSKVRSQIKKAEKNGVCFRWADSKDMDSFYRVFSINMQQLGSPVHDKAFLAAVLQRYGSRARLGVVEFDNRCIGGGIILSTERSVSIPWASTLREHNKRAPNMLLYWNFLEYAADSGKQTFDFGRSTPDEGTYRFKKQWGAEPVPLIWYNTSPTGSEDHRDQDAAPSGRRSAITSLWQKLPLPVANRLGPSVRKYINL